MSLHICIKKSTAIATKYIEWINGKYQVKCNFKVDVSRRLWTITPYLEKLHIRGCIFLSISSARSSVVVYSKINKLRSSTFYDLKVFDCVVSFQITKKRMHTFVHVSIFSHPCHCEFLSKSFVYHVKP